MAQAQIDCCKADGSSNPNNRENSKRVDEHDAAVSAVPECAVCLQLCIHPARLPCNHVFCYLCVKGVANQSKRCPMCRQEIPADFLERPQLVDMDQAQQKEAVSTETEESHEEYQWFYEGRNGWWKYDPRTNELLQTVFDMGETQYEVAICGTLYIIDFQQNCQYKKYQPSHKRQIKRDHKDAPCWWQYDQRTSLELETAYKQGKRSCELLIAGFLYIADFSSMFQLRRNDHSRRRRIKRDLYNVPKKGVAGLRLNNQPLREQEEPQQQNLVREIRGAERPASPASDNMGDGNNTPIPPSNTPQTPAGGTASGDATPSTATRLLDHQRQDSLHQVLEQMRSLVLRETFSSSNQQDLPDSIDDHSFSDHSLLPWLHQTSSNTTYSSDEEHA